MVEIITVPGIGGSGELHWQSRWEGSKSAMAAPPAPRLGSALNSTTGSWRSIVRWGQSENSPLLVAHSLGCLLVAHWQQVSTAQVAGAFLVAVPNPEAPAFPIEAASFTDPPRTRFRFPSLIIASANDPYGGVEYARARASQWGGSFVEAGELGHINEASKLEDWPQGKALLTAFAAGTAHLGDP